jgi:putative transposase
MCIFKDDDDYLRFLGIFGDVIDNYGVECWNLCVLHNHYHAVLRPTLPNLPEAMQTLNGSYALWWARRHGHVGHVWQGRYKDPIVDADQYLLVLCRYIALNPVRAGLVKSPDQWRWSSYAASVGRAPRPSFLTVDPILRQFGEGPPAELRRRYVNYVEAVQNQEVEFDRIRSNAQFLGSREFQRRVETRIATDAALPTESMVVPARSPDSGSDRGLTRFRRG